MNTEIQLLDQTNLDDVHEIESVTASLSVLCTPMTYLARIALQLFKVSLLTYHNYVLLHINNSITWQYCLCSYCNQNLHGVRNTYGHSECACTTKMVSGSAVVVLL